MTRTTYGFSPSLLRDLCSATDATVADLADAARISTGELRCHLAGECGEPAPEVLLRLASALSALPRQLCSVTDERLIHLRVWTGRSTDAMARALRLPPHLCTLTEDTGYIGCSARVRYRRSTARWLTWQDWAAPYFGVTSERLASATETTRSHWHTVGHHRPTLPWWSPPD
ncbi:hypothetical protein ABZ747_34930 [Kitasatospora cineracea]|uniref:hypothetical protein n=1 Tax=Kitasatospora cineracea TaxID=88074 RepID=UPI0033D75032